MSVIKVILPLIEIPDGSLVTKITGRKEYTVQSTIKVHGLPSTSEIKSDGVKFLVSEDGTGNINAHVNTFEVLWHVNKHEVEALLDILGVDRYMC